MIKRTAVWLILFQLVFADVYGAESFSGTIKKIIDGDSLLISTDRGNIEVRLYGIDCPEYRQPYSRAAKKYIKSNFSGRTVLLNSFYHDKYGRKVSLVFNNQRVLNRELIEAGLALVYPAYCRKPFCKEWKKEEERARQEKKGLWQQQVVIPPWQWKRMKKKEQG